MPGEPANRFADIRRYAAIDSTNRYLLDCAAAGEPEGVVAVADEQTAGRGRLDRSWLAPPGAALLVSVLLRPRLPIDRLHLVTLAAALAAIDAVTALATVDARLKWPNDVVIGDRKLAGILAESDGAGAIVVGMGLNVRGDWFPPELEATATACAVDRDELLTGWLRALDTRLDSLDGVVRDARAHSATLGRRVRVELAHDSFEGVARDLTPEGYLVVDGRVVTAGDVVHLRPA
jgi:BirA family transcriptional regulator, biotin operon repressor / biotin---[acetyl-CoA-carboxylase] ligase